MAEYLILIYLRSLESFHCGMTDVCLAGVVCEAIWKIAVVLNEGNVEEERFHFSYPSCALNILKQSQSVGNLKSHHLVSWIFISFKCFLRILSLRGTAFQPVVQVSFENQA